MGYLGRLGLMDKLAGKHLQSFPASSALSAGLCKVSLNDILGLERVSSSTSLGDAHAGEEIIHNSFVVENSTCIRA